MKSAAAFAALLLLLSSASAEFLAGFDPAGGEIWVLCEGHPEAFVSGGGGQPARLELDGGRQASYRPQAGGPYIIQCGAEATEVLVPAAGGPLPLISAEGQGAVALAVSIAIPFCAAALLLLAARLAFSRTWFCKTVEGKCARIIIRAGRRMERITVRDPVAAGFAGRGPEFQIPLIEAGREWRAEYEYGSPPGRALPASLSALVGGRKHSMLSLLVSDSPACPGNAWTKSADRLCPPTFCLGQKGVPFPARKSGHWNYANSNTMKKPEAAKPARRKVARHNGAAG